MSVDAIQPIRDSSIAATSHPKAALAGSSSKTARDEASRSGIWITIFAISMSFAAFTSAMIVRQGSGNDWSHIAMPSILFWNTLVLLLSSAGYEFWRRSSRLSASSDSSLPSAGISWLIVTLALGFLFVAGQYVAWKQLRAAGLFLSTSPNSSFYYVITAMHALHVLAGMAALIYLLVRLTSSPSKLRTSTVESTRVYWHFMGILWLFLFFVMNTTL
jgi:cytochrome c oxidase subunit III